VLLHLVVPRAPTDFPVDSPDASFLFYYSITMLFPTASPLSYAQATSAQQSQALLALRQQLRYHFPTLPERAFAHALAEFDPELLFHQEQPRFSYPELTQLIQLLDASPELPLLDPPRYGLPALRMAQHSLRTSELAVRALAELLAQRTRCGSHLYALLQRLVYLYPLAEQVVQAWSWNLPSSPALPLVTSRETAVPSSREVTHYLQQLAAASGLGG